MTAMEFSREMNVDYSTVIRWLKNGIVPGAELVEPIAGMKVWQIPETAMEMERPLAGRKRPESKTQIASNSKKKAKAK